MATVQKIVYRPAVSPVANPYQEAKFTFNVTLAGIEFFTVGSYSMGLPHAWSASITRTGVSLDWVQACLSQDIDEIKRQTATMTNYAEVVINGAVGSDYIRRRGLRFKTAVTPTLDYYLLAKRCSIQYRSASRGYVFVSDENDFTAVPLSAIGQLENGYYWSNAGFKSNLSTQWRDVNLYLDAEMDDVIIPSASFNNTNLRGGDIGFEIEDRTSAVVVDLLNQSSTAHQIQFATLSGTAYEI